MSISSIKFERLPAVDDLSGVIEDIFGVKLDISGGWGYDNNSAVVVHSLDMPIDQFLFIFANIRANTEMNLFLEEEDRYSGINVDFLEGKQVEIIESNKVYDMITFEITAMKESTIKIQSDFWFEGLENYYHSTN